MLYNIIYIYNIIVFQKVVKNDNIRINQAAEAKAEELRQAVTKM